VGVALGRLAPQRLQHDGVEITAQRAATAGRGHAARAWHVGLHDRVLQCNARCAAQAVGPRVGEQLEKHDAERVDVAGGAQRPAEDLLRARVLGRQRPAGLACQRGFLGHAGVQQLGDAEVQQLHVPGVGDQDVRRLEVAVDDELRVGVRHRARDLQEQAQPLGQRQAALEAVGIDAPAVDMFQRQPRLAVGRDPGFVQARDVRVLQRGQDLALARQSLGQAGAPPGAVRQLERHLAALQQVGPLGQPDAAHAAAAQFPDQAVGADGIAGTLAGQAGGVGRRAALRGAHDRQRVEQAHGGGRGSTGHTVIGGVGQQRLQSRPQRRVAVVQPRQPGGAIGGWQGQGFVQQHAQLRPGGWVEAECVGHGGATSAPRPGTVEPAPSRAARCGR
jgi:hypothetical protein